MAELVLALDVGTADEAFRLLDRLPDVRWVKVGSILYSAQGPAVVESLQSRGLSVFLDLKWHDIPNTVAGAVSQARALGVQMATVHALGGPAMIRAAKDAAGDGLSVVAVTVLTSHDPEGWSKIVGRPVEGVGTEVERLARLAVGAGADGVVSSPEEVAALRAALGPAALLVTPGIRSASDDRGDQARVATVKTAVAAGSTHLVVGRPVLRADDPVAAWSGMIGDLAA
ncbi:MAG: orotidine-5'-phosphate decarboxylase [Gemmatimonadales bacterium]